MVRILVPCCFDPDPDSDPDSDLDYCVGRPNEACGPAAGKISFADRLTLGQRIGITGNHTFFIGGNDQYLDSTFV